jgi:hypothetical protein
MPSNLYIDFCSKVSDSGITWASTKGIVYVCVALVVFLMYVLSVFCSEGISSVYILNSVGERAALAYFPVDVLCCPVSFLFNYVRISWLVPKVRDVGCFFHLIRWIVCVCSLCQMFYHNLGRGNVFLDWILFFFVASVLNQTLHVCMICHTFHIGVPIRIFQNSLSFAFNIFACVL